MSYSVFRGSRQQHRAALVRTYNLQLHLLAVHCETLAELLENELALTTALLHAVGPAEQETIQRIQAQFSALQGAVRGAVEALESAAMKEA